MIQRHITISQRAARVSLRPALPVMCVILLCFDFFVCLILNYSFHGDHLEACTLGSLNHSSFFVVKKKPKKQTTTKKCVCDLGLYQSLLPPPPLTWGQEKSLKSDFGGLQILNLFMKVYLFLAHFNLNPNDSGEASLSRCPFLFDCAFLKKTCKSLSLRKYQFFSKFMGPHILYVSS